VIGVFELVNFAENLILKIEFPKNFSKKNKKKIKRSPLAARTDLFLAKTVLGKWPILTTSP